MTPLELEISEVLAFVLGALPPPGARVLEVGCGGGALAARLLAEGYQLTAIDASARACEEARTLGVPAQQIDFFDYRGGPFDAVLFTRSLHHLDPLPAAVEHTRGLLREAGVLVCDEFALDAVDAPTAAWFYDLQAALEAAGALEPDRPRHHHHPRHEPAPIPDDPLERWRQRHGHQPPLHPGTAMLEAAAARFRLGTPERRAYLHRYLVERLPADGRGAAIFSTLRDREKLRVAQGLLQPAGLRFSGRVG
jgi:SAM-dependent methyltransferase